MNFNVACSQSSNDHRLSYFNEKGLPKTNGPRKSDVCHVLSPQHLRFDLMILYTIESKLDQYNVHELFSLRLFLAPPILAIS